MTFFGLQAVATHQDDAVKIDQRVVDYALLRAQITPDRELAHDARNLVARYIGLAGLTRREVPDLKKRLTSLERTMWSFAKTGRLKIPSTTRLKIAEPLEMAEVA